MDLPIAVRLLASYDELPIFSVKYLRDNWEQVVDDLLQRLDDFVADRDRSEEATSSLLAIIYLLAEHKEYRAFSNICELLLLGEVSEEVLGDGLTQHMPAILISTFSGDGTALRRVVESADADEWVRSMALTALAFLVASGSYSDIDISEYLMQLRRTETQNSSYIWTVWVNSIAWLGLDHLRSEVESAFDEGLIDEFTIDEDSFFRSLELTINDPDRMAGFKVDGIGPLTDALDALSTWYPLSSSRVTNPITNRSKIGRNDRCPCGSGKKYKACCLRTK